MEVQACSSINTRRTEGMAFTNHHTLSYSSLCASYKTAGLDAVNDVKHERKTRRGTMTGVKDGDRRCATLL